MTINFKNKKSEEMFYFNLVVGPNIDFFCKSDIKVLWSQNVFKYLK